MCVLAVGCSDSGAGPVDTAPGLTSAATTGEGSGDDRPVTIVGADAGHSEIVATLDRDFLDAGAKVIRIASPRTATLQVC